MPACPTARLPRRRASPRARSAPPWPAPAAGWSRPIREEARRNMSHADDGTLHAYLDGELSALEAARLEAHLAECAPCRARLAEERDVLNRASRILALAEPP